MTYAHTRNAGNEGDVFKHFMLAGLLAHYITDNGCIWYLETHAGAGLYALPDDTGRTQAIFRIPPAGIPAANIPSFHHARGDNPANRELYPGSPIIAQSILRLEDRMTLFERAPLDFERLHEVLKRDKLDLRNEDGFLGVPEMMRESGALDDGCEPIIFIDPDYIEDGDWDRVLGTVGEITVTRPGSTIIVWYPTFRHYPAIRAEDREAFRTVLENLSIDRAGAFLWQEIQTHGPAETSLNGAGMCILNARPGTRERLISALLSGHNAYRVARGNLNRKIT